jgi:membrane protein YqaA with SNARE-associated domain
MIRRIYDGLIALAGGKRAGMWLALVAFAESSFFPIPPDVMLLPMCVARPARAFHFASICTVASVLGGCFGYLIGAELYTQLAAHVIHAYHLDTAFDGFRAQYARWGIWVILIKGLTPIPYKLVTISAGVAGYNFPAFVALSLVTRGVRFFMVAGLLRVFGEEVRDFVERRLTMVTTAAAVTIVAGFVALRYL